MTTPKLECHVTMLGSGLVGKSALTVCLVAGNFISDYDPTIEDSYRKELLVDEQPVRLEILDTAGQEEFRSMREKWMREGDGFMLVFDLTRKETYQYILDLHGKLITNSPKKGKVPIILVGNKSDLVNDDHEKRHITVNEAKLKAKDWKCGYIETSAKNGTNVLQCYMELVRAVRLYETSLDQPPKKHFCTVL